MDNQMQEAENDNLIIVDNASLNEWGASPTVGNETYKELSVPSVSENMIENLSSSPQTWITSGENVISMNITLWIAWIFVVWVIVFFGLNSYESNNKCILKFDTSGSLLTCVPIKKRETPKEDCWENIFCTSRAQPMKPLILLYPIKEQEVQVKLQYAPWFSATFPDYDDSKKGWSVTANSDGTLFDHATGQETYWLFWEGNAYNGDYDLSKGFVIQGSDVREFLYEKLTEIGLSTKEKSDFIMFWYPKLQDYPYLQITFAWDDYSESAPLEISPKPDSLLRVFMVAKPLKSPINIEPQTFTPFERKGFSVVEWGGTIVE
jgi:hypothetical protein